MMDEDKQPFSLRKAYYEIFPKWFVDWVLAPFSDEVGRLPVLAKSAGQGAALAALFVLVVPDAYQGPLACAIVLVALATAVVILALFGARR
jgi:hypothetical protein